MSRGRHQQQPQYDFISRNSPPTAERSSRETLKTSQVVRPGESIALLTLANKSGLTRLPDENNEDLRKTIHKLRYEVDTLRQERDLTALRHEEELRATQSRAEADYKRAQSLETSNNSASSKYEALASELRDSQERAAAEKDELERKLRSLQEQNNALEEQKEEAQNELSTQERHFKHDIDELKVTYEPLQQSCETLREDRDEKTKALQSAQQRLSESDEQVSKMEAEILKLKTQTGDADAIAIIKRELSEQVAYIRKLEAQDTDQRIELKQLRKQHKSIEVVEEEKRNLQNKVEMMNDLRKELNEAHLQKQMLQDERQAWSSYLESAAANEDNDDFKFESPADLAKAFYQIRVEKLSLIDELGKVRPELSSKDETIYELESQLTTTREELEKLKASSSGESTASGSSGMNDAKLRARVERQRALAIKEVEYLREQLKTFDAEELEISPEQHDAQKTERITELENMVEQYRTELNATQADLSASHQTQQQPPPQVAGSKRSHDTAHDGPTDADPDTPTKSGSLARKLRTLQDDLSGSQTARQVLQKDLESTRAQLSSVKSASRTRVLEFRDNPTARHESVKREMLEKLRDENNALLARLTNSTDDTGDGDPNDNSNTENRDPDASPSKKRKRNDGGGRATTKTVPASTAERLRADISERDDALASKDKHVMRLKQIWTSKSLEFREAVASILGWKLDFMPNGRVRVSSMFDKKNNANSKRRKGGAGVEEVEEEEEEERSIIFDGEAGTMKVSGGPQSRFANEIKGLIDFWVDGRKEVPCFLAACTLEFWERFSGGGMGDGGGDGQTIRV
ncbi:MAG: coiled-coil domain-containing protein mad1 [Alyxoria varia]|nr:MAG: coiled-coil domain-containing protein mad1 [Alyxoria varia]